MELQLPEDFKEFLKCLHESNARYLLVGGYAVTWYGYPRTTADMDIWVEMSEENAERVIQAFKKFGIAESAIPKHSLLKENEIFRLGVAPLRLEIMTSVSGLVFDHAWQNKGSLKVDGELVWVISKADLITNKKSSGRTKDIADVEYLENEDW